ncbi:MAG TPA: hypothetical protein VF787_19860 [Thermoanaerobaculia bacterium]
MKRSTGMSLMRGSLLVALAVIVLACGRNETTASKSAAAYREAKAKGIPVSGGHEHGGHDATAATDTSGTMDHSAHGTGADTHAGHNMAAEMDHGAPGAMSATDHDAMAHGSGASAHATMSAANHAAMGHDTATNAHAGHTTTSAGAMDHSAHAAMTGAGPDQHAGMQHGASTAAADAHAYHQQAASANAHAGHGATQKPAAGAPEVVLGAPTSSAAVARVRPGATLQPDDFDAPAPIAVEEAQKAVGAGGHEGQEPQPNPHSGHTSGVKKEK